MKKDTKAWIKIAEAFLAIVVVLAAFLIIMNNQTKSVDDSEDIYKMQRAILEIISKNDTLRADILLGTCFIGDLCGDTTRVNETIKKMIPGSWKFETKICSFSEICGRDIWVENLYVDEIMITANLTDYSPRKLKLFVWFE